MTDINNDPTLHFVSFQIPYPPSYGGVIDVYYKIKALKEAGCHIILHTFKYGREETEKLYDIADEVYYYQRATGIMSQLSLLPYIVYSRRNKELLKRLKKDNHPIVFEGLHTCYYLNHPDLKERIKIVRSHNIEHQYYYKLYTSSFYKPKSVYYLIEAIKLKFFERILHHASGILAITSKDCEYFKRKYNNTDVILTPCFYENSNIKTTDNDYTTQPYMLYHGNLSVYENIKAAKFIIKNIMPKLKGRKLIIAGMNPTKEIRELVSESNNIELIDSPTEAIMDNLIKHAHINILITFQDTGIKLKLINALSKGNGFCIVNDMMLSEPSLKEVCIEANSTNEFADVINSTFDRKTTEEDILQRKSFINHMYSNEANAKKIMNFIYRKL